MQLTVLGSSGTYPGPDRACSGYLLTEPGTSVLLDCGPGAFSHLLRHSTLRDLIGVLITHMHYDHFLDLIPIRYALNYGSHRRPDSLPLYLPPGGTETWDRLAGTLGESAEQFSSCFSISEYPRREEFSVGTLTVRATPLRHSIPGYGFTVQGEETLAYTGDTGPCPQLQEIAYGSDLFLYEASLLDTEIPPDERGHLTAAEAGTAANQAGIQQLMLTHLMPDTVPNEAVQRARATFSDGILLAEQGHTCRVNTR